MRAHHGDFFPRLLRRQHRLVAHAFPGDAVRACCVTNPGMAFRLSGVPQVITVSAFQNHGAVDAVFPTGFRTRAKDDLRRLAPMNAVLTFHQREGFLRSPGKPHAVVAMLAQNGNVETRSILSAHDGVALEFFPAARSFRRRGRRQPARDSHELFRRNDFLSVGNDAQSLALAVALSGFVPENRQRPPMIADMIKAEIIPGGGHERIHLHRVVRARAQSDQSADDEIAERGVVVILAAVRRALLPLDQQRARDPIAVGGILIFVNPRNDAAIGELEPLRLRVDFQQCKVVIRTNHFLRRAIQQVRQARQRDRRCERPTRPVPLTFVAGVSELESLMTLLRRRQPERREKSVCVHQLFPRDVELRVGQIDVPRSEAVKFAGGRERFVFAARQDFEELRVRVPKFFLHQLLDRGRFVAVLADDVGLAGQFRDPRDRQRIAELIAVDSRAITAAADRDFHPVLAILLPEQAVRIAIRLFPSLVVCDQVRQQLRDHRSITRHAIARPHRIRRPETVATRFATAAKPEAGIVIEKLWITQPASFVKVMSGGAVDGVVFSGPAHVGQKLIHDEARWSSFDVLPVSPPAKVVGGLDVIVRAVEQRNVVLQKIPGRRVGEFTLVEFLVVPLEVIEVMLERFRLEHGVGGCGRGQRASCGTKGGQHNDEGQHSLEARIQAAAFSVVGRFHAALSDESPSEVKPSMDSTDAPTVGSRSIFEERRLRSGDAGSREF